MKVLDLAYVGLGVHEQLVAHVADQMDYFREEGVHVAIRDGCTWSIDRLGKGAMVALGRAQVSRLSEGVPWVVTCVNTDRPMFWLLGQPEYEQVGELRGRRIGVHVEASAPWLWTRIVLRRHSVDPDRDVELVPVDAGSYAVRRQMLRAGDLDAAVVGSTVFPEQVAADDGLRILAFFGDHLQMPSTGIAVDARAVALNSPALRGLTTANRRALRTIVEDPDVAIASMRAIVSDLDEVSGRSYYETYVKPSFLIDGQPDQASVEQALAVLAREMGGVAVPTYSELYRTGTAVKAT